MPTPLFHKPAPTVEDLQARLQDLLDTVDLADQETLPVLQDCLERFKHYDTHPQLLDFIVTARGVIVLLNCAENFSDWLGEGVTSAVVFEYDTEIDVILGEPAHYLTDEEIMMAGSLLF